MIKKYLDSTYNNKLQLVKNDKFFTINVIFY